MITDRIAALAERKFYEFQSDAPTTSNDLLTWDECRAWADPDHPNYAPIYAAMFDRFIQEAIMEMN